MSSGPSHQKGPLHMEWNHQEEKMYREAQQRDHIRAKLSQGRRWRAEEDADRLVAETLKIKERNDLEIDRQHRPVGRDDAMNTVLKELHKDKSIKKFTI